MNGWEVGRGVGQAAVLRAVVESALTGRQARLRGELAARNRLGDAAPPRVVVQARRPDSLNLLLGERPCLTLSRLRGPCNVTGGRACDGWRRLDRLGFRISVRARLVAV